MPAGVEVMVGVGVIVGVAVFVGVVVRVGVGLRVGVGVVVGVGVTFDSTQFTAQVSVPVVAVFPPARVATREIHSPAVLFSAAPVNLQVFSVAAIWQRVPVLV